MIHTNICMNHPRDGSFYSMWIYLEQFIPLPMTLTSTRFVFGERYFGKKESEVNINHFQRNNSYKTFENQGKRSDLSRGLLRRQKGTPV
jgi:hypothetical protein